MKTINLAIYDFQDYRAIGAIFRGPSWVSTNWYHYWGLRQHGFEDIASELVHRTVEMIKRGGMRECFNPYSAEGYETIDLVGPL